MSEIQDAAQIIKVSLEGVEVLLKIGKLNWDLVKGICAVFKRMLDQEKLAGKTSVRQLLKSGGDLQVFKFRTEDLQIVKKMADKYGILYSILPDLNKKDGMSEILFHSQAVPRIQAMMEQIQDSRIESMDDYFSNAEPKELRTLKQEAEKAYGKTNQANHGELFQGTSVENRVSADKMEAIRKIQKESIKNPKVNGITIARKLVMDETEQGIKTRIPYKPNEYIWLPKSEITWINDNKTVYAGLEKEREYQVVDGADRPIRKVSGQDLYKQSYDPVSRNLEGREQERIRRRKNQMRQNEIQNRDDQPDMGQQNNIIHNKKRQNAGQQNRANQNQRKHENYSGISKGATQASRGRRAR